MSGFAWLTACISTLFFGLLIDKIGCRAILVKILSKNKAVISSLLTLTSSIMIWFVEPLIGLIILGLGFGLSYASIWTGVLNVVSPELYGKAFGFIIAL